MKTLFKNAFIVTSTGITSGEVLVNGSTIEKVSFGCSIDGKVDKVVDVQGLYLSPGFIDVHTHGAGGADFMDGDLESIYTACRMHLRHGTTSIVPTTITSTKQSLYDFIDLFNQVDLHAPDCPNILGLHLEGPYFSYDQRGAQDPENLRNPDPDEYLSVLEKTDRIIRWSFAIELPGAMEFVKVLRDRNIVCSLAHSDATCEEVFRAYEQGVTALTHFYSGMSGVKRVNAYRVAGAIEAGYLLDDMVCEVISDGKHLPKELLQLIYKVKGPDKICLVTDSMRGAGMPDGNSMLGNAKTGLPCIVEDGVAKLMDRSAFAGSVATTDRLVRTFRNLTTAPLFEVVKMATLNPATLMNLQKTKGSICEGKDADLIIFDEDINIQKTMVMGTFM